MAGETTLHLKHDPIAMGWQVGDRTGKHGETTMTLLTVTFGVTKCNKALSTHDVCGIDS